MMRDLRATLPDGRKVEMVDARWSKGLPDDPPNVLPVDVTISVDGVLETVRVLISDEEALAAFERDAEGSG